MTDAAEGEFNPGLATAIEMDTGETDAVVADSDRRESARPAVVCVVSLSCAIGAAPLTTLP